MANKSPVILLGEDDEYISRAYTAGFKREGYTVINAYSGAEVLEKMRTDKPNLLLLDIIMPEQNGFEVLEAINNDKSLSAIPVVVMSNLGQDDDISRALSLGAKEYLVKSNYSMAEVVACIKEYVST